MHSQQKQIFAPTSLRSDSLSDC